MNKVTLPALATLAGALMAWPLAKAAEIVVIDLRSAQMYYDGPRFEHELYDEGAVSYDYEEPDSSPSPRLSPLKLSFYDLTPIDYSEDGAEEDEPDAYDDEPDAYDEEDDSYDDEETDYD